MILQYDMSNNLSFKEKQRIITFPSPDLDREESLISQGEYKGLPVIAIYGKNASGKTNTLMSLKHIFDMVSYSHTFDPVRPIPLYTPFLFTQDKDQRSSFEIMFVVQDTRYIYGFVHNAEEIKEEYLYRYQEEPVKIFDRDMDSYTYGASYEDLNLYERMTHKNKLFLSVVAQWAADKKELSLVYDFFRNGFMYYQKDCDSNSANEFEKESTRLILENPEAKELINHLITYLDLEFQEVEAMSMALYPLELSDVKTVYRVDDKKYEIDLKDESNGIRKLYQLFAIVYHALQAKKIVVIDEIEMGLHPILVEKFIELFQNSKINKHGSQLIFTTQLTNILKTTLFRKDQIYFAERNRANYSTEIYPLSVIKGVRATDNIEKDYLNGQYVNVPSSRGWLDDLDG